MPRNNRNNNNGLAGYALGDLFGFTPPQPENLGISSVTRGKYSCLVCDAEMAPSRRRTCSAACRAARKRELDRASYRRIQAERRAISTDRICAECGAQFTASNPEGPINKTCSEACRVARWKRQTREHTRKSPVAQLACRACGQPIERRTNGPGRQPGFCSETCRCRVKLADARAERALMRMRRKLANPKY